MTIVHIAAEPEGPIQRCARCQEILIDLRGAMVLNGHQVGSWKPTAFVGVIRGNPTCSFLMDRDALEADELRCDILTPV